MKKRRKKKKEEGRRKKKEEGRKKEEEEGRWNNKTSKTTTFGRLRNTTVCQNVEPMGTTFCQNVVFRSFKKVVVVEV